MKRCPSSIVLSVVKMPREFFIFLLSNLIEYFLDAIIVASSC